MTGMSVLFKQLPFLDLQMTPAVCAGSRKIIPALLERFHPYQHDSTLFLEIRVNVSDYTQSMRWLLENGCDCTPEIAQIETATMQFKDTPERATFLSDLAELKKNLRH